LDRDLRPRVLRVARGALITLVLSLAAGYVLFLRVFPVVAFPTSGDMPLAPAVGLLALVALIAGFASDDLAVAMVASVASIVVSIAVAGLMALSPMAQGFTMLDPGSSFAFVVHYGFPFILVSFAIDVVGGIGGYAIRERYILAPPSFQEAAQRSQRK
jgi:hypothetical protein